MTTTLDEMLRLGAENSRLKAENAALQKRTEAAELLIIKMRGMAALIKLEWENTSKTPGYGTRMYGAALCSLEMSEQGMPSFSDKFSAVWERATMLVKYLKEVAPHITSRAEYMALRDALKALEDA